MTNEIIAGIGQQINKLLGDGYQIYVDHVPQDIQKPYFLVSLLETIKTELSKERSTRTRSFLIKYVPGGITNAESDCRDIGDFLLNEMNFIQIEGMLIKCTSTKYEIKDGILHFYMSCNTIARTVKDQTKMENKTLNVDVKG